MSIIASNSSVSAKKQPQQLTSSLSTKLSAMSIINDEKSQSRSELSASSSSTPSTYVSLKGKIENLKEKCIIVIRSKSHPEQSAQSQIVIPTFIENKNKNKNTNDNGDSCWIWSTEVVKNQIYRIDCVLNKINSEHHMTILSTMLTTIDADNIEILMTI
jgi:hypothetical protein